MTFQATHALLRTVVLAVVALALALLTAQPALIVIAAPFVVWAVFGVLRRPPSGEPPPVLSLSASRVVAGQTIELQVASSLADRTIDARFAPVADAEFEPRWGAVCATGEPALVRASPSRWGRVELPAADVVVTDAWGMWSAHTRLRGQTVSASVVPDVPGRGDTLPHPIGIAGLHQSARRGDGSSLADIRPFVPGDRLHRVNWRVTSRTGQLHTNATHAERDTDVLVVADTLADVTTAELADDGAYASSLDTTVVAAASVMEHYLRLGDRVGLHDLGAVIGSVPARTGVRQFAVLSEKLARAQTTPPPWTALRPIVRLRPGAFVVVCSPLLERGVLDEVFRLVHRGAAVVVIDTLPPRLGTLAPRASRRGPRGAGHGGWEEAWVLRRMEREADLRRLRELGIPVTPWRGVNGLAALAASLASGRSRARIRPGGAT